MNRDSEKVYIERALVEEMLENADIISNGEYCGYCTEDVNLGSIPTADVSLARHARWEEASDGDGIVCSECGTDFCIMVYETDKFNYCPACGSRMDAKDDAS